MFLSLSALLTISQTGATVWKTVFLCFAQIKSKQIKFYYERKNESKIRHFVNQIAVQSCFKTNFGQASILCVIEKLTTFLTMFSTSIFNNISETCTFFQECCIFPEKLFWKPLSQLRPAFQLIEPHEAAFCKKRKAHIKLHLVESELLVIVLTSAFEAVISTFKLRNINITTLQWTLHKTLTKKFFRFTDQWNEAFFDTGYLFPQNTRLFYK